MAHRPANGPSPDPVRAVARPAGPVITRPAGLARVGGPNRRVALKLCGGARPGPAYGNARERASCGAGVDEPARPEWATRVTSGPVPADRAAGAPRRVARIAPFGERVVASFIPSDAARRGTRPGPRAGRGPTVVAAPVALEDRRAWRPGHEAPL